MNSQQQSDLLSPHSHCRPVLSAEVNFVLNQMKDAIALFDQEQRLILWNQALANLWEVSPAWLETQPNSEAIWAKLTAQQHWLAEHCQVLQQALDRSDAQWLPLTQPDRALLEAHFCTTPNQQRLCLFVGKTGQTNEPFALPLGDIPTETAPLSSNFKLLQRVAQAQANLHEERTASLQEAIDRLQNEIQRRTQVEQKLAQINECFLSFKTDPIANINRLTTLCGKLLGATCVLYCRFANDRLHLVGQWQTALDHPLEESTQGQICADLLRQANLKPIVLRHLDRSPYTNSDPNLERYLPKTYLGQAVLGKEGAIGTISVFYAADVVPSEDDQRLLGIITAAIGIEEERCWSREALKQQTLRSQLFADISFKIRQSLQREDILETAVTEVRALLEADRVLVYRLESDGSGKVTAESLLSGQASLLGQSFPPDVFPGDYLQLYRLGETRMIDNLQQPDLRPSDVPFLEELEVKAELVVPILQQETLWGLLIVHQCSAVRPWSTFELQLVQPLADQVGIALEQSRLLQALQESEERFRLMADTAPVLLWVAGTDGLRTFVNRSWLQFTGKVIDHEVGNGWLRGVHPDDRPLCLTTYTSALQTRDSFKEEYRLQRADGSYRWILDTGIPRFTPDGELIGYIGSCIDITEHKQAEADIRKALEQEKELNELKSRFVSMTSHEFRTPLSTLLLSAGLLERYGDQWPDEKKQKHFRRIQSSVRHMTQLLDDVLLLGKAEAGKLTFKPSQIDLDTFCRDLTEEMQFNTSSHQLIFTREGDPLPAQMDKKLLRSLLSNLLANAIKYSTQGGNIHFRLHYHPDQATFQVQDHGIGIPTEDQKHLFESFHRAKNAETIPGTGLGLTIAKRCIDLHHGKVQVESNIGEGTTFTVTLPLNQPAS